MQCTLNSDAITLLSMVVCARPDRRRRPALTTVCPRSKSGEYLGKCRARRKVPGNRDQVIGDRVIETSPTPGTYPLEPVPYRVRPGELGAPRSQYIERSTTTGLEAVTRVDISASG